MVFYFNLMIILISDYVESITNKRSTFRYYSLLRGNLITWKSKKESMVLQANAKSKLKTILKKVCKAL